MADKLLSTVKGFQRGTVSATSTGGNYELDSGKALVFSPAGNIIGSSQQAGISAVRGAGSSSAPGVTGISTSGDGVTGTSTSGKGVVGTTASGIAGSFTSNTGSAGFFKTSGAGKLVEFVGNGDLTNTLFIDSATKAFKWTLGSINIGTLIPANISANRTWTLPDATGTLAIDSLVVHIAGAETITGDKNFNAYSENQINSTTTSGGTLCTLVITASTFQVLTLTASAACVVTMPPVGTGRSLTLMVRQPAVTGNASATFTNVQWGSAGAPTITVAAGKMDILTFVSDGGKWYGSYIQGFTY